MKIVLTFLGLLLNSLFMYSQNIIINFYSVYSQYEDYVTLYNDKIADIYYSLISGDNNITIPQKGMNDLSYKIVPSTSIQVIQKREDTIFITLIIDYRILPELVFVFNDKDLIAIMRRHRLGYTISKVIKGSNYADHFKYIRNDKKDLIFSLCEFHYFLIVEKNGFKIVTNFGNSHEDNKTKLYKFLNETYYYHPCDPSYEPIILPGLDLVPYKWIK